MQAIQSEKGLVQPEWHQVCAGLHRSGEDDVRYWALPITRCRHGAENTDGAVRLYLVTPEDFRGNMTAAKLKFYGGETYTATNQPARPAEDAHQRQRLRRRVLLWVWRQADGDVRRRADGVDVEGDGQLRQLYLGSWSSAMVSTARPGSSGRCWHVL